jgi:RND family efflux transporter MFP subunit
MKYTFKLAPLALVLAGLACGKQEAVAVPALPTAKVHLVMSGQGMEANWIAATLTATQHATLSTRLAASVKKVYVNEGQSVAAGALLVSLSDEDLQAGLKAAEAALAAATAYHRRIEALIAQKAAIPAEMDQAQTQLASAKAAVSQMKANLAYTQIRAPFAGVIQSRLVTEGAFAGPGTPLLELDGQGEPELVSSVSESESQGLKIGRQLSFEADGSTGTATITALATGGDPASHRGTLRARIQGGARALQGGAGLRTGSFARLRLPGTSQAIQTLSVPRSALLQRGDLNGVFVNHAGKAELHWLSLGELQGDRFPVRAGLAKDDQVIDQPGSLQDGQPVEVSR